MFYKEDVINDGKEQTLIKVSKCKLGVSTFWSLDKFEQRLSRMRDLYQVHNKPVLFTSYVSVN